MVQAAIRREKLQERVDKLSQLNKEALTKNLEGFGIHLTDSELDQRVNTNFLITIPH